MNNIKNSIDTFTNNQKRLHESMSNLNTSKLQAAIDSKREMDKQDRIKELEAQNKDLVERIEKSQKNQIWIAILSAIIGSVITVLLQKFLQ